MNTVQYHGHRIVLLTETEFEVFQSGTKKMVAWGLGFSDPLTRAKELIDNEFVTPLLENLRLLKNE